MTEKIFDQKLLKLLACPKDKARLDYNKNRNELICSKCKTVYLIKNGIPLLLPKK